MNRRIRYLLFRLKNDKLIVFIVSFVLGVYLAETFVWLLLGQVCWFFIVLVIFFVFVKKLRVLLLIIVVGSFLGFYRYHFYHSANFINVSDNYEKEISEEVKVVRDSVFKNNKQQVLVESEEYGYILVTCARYPEFFYGNILNVEGVLVEPPEFEGFSYKEFLKTQNINYLISRPNIDLMSMKSKTIDLGFYAAKIRGGGSKNVQKIFSEPHASLIQGLVFGSKRTMPEDFEKNLMVTGTTHIISVSGYNVALVLALILKFGKKLPRRLLVILMSLALFLFILVIGLDNLPALRAVLMGYVFLFGAIVGRGSGMVNSLCVVVFFLVFQNPLVLNSVSFQLSVVATFGIVLFSKPIKDFLDKNKFPKILVEDTSATLSAILWTLPISIGSFSSLSLHALIVNILVLPFVSFATIGGIIIVVISFVSLRMARIFSYIEWFVLEYVVSVIDYFGRYDALYLDSIEIKSIYLVFVYLLFGGYLLERSYQQFLCNLSTRK